MNTEINSKIEKLLNELISLKGILPGSISTQYNVCGTPNCKCKDKENPIKHGPYYQLSYTVLGKSSSKFIKKEDFNIATEMCVNYKRFKEICSQLPALYIDLFRAEGFNADIPDVHNIIESTVITEQKKQIDKLEGKLSAVRKTAYTNTVTINDIKMSREIWKRKAIGKKNKVSELEQENAKLKQLLKK